MPQPTQVQPGHAIWNLTCKTTDQARDSVVTLCTLWTLFAPSDLVMSQFAGAFFAPGGLLDLSMISPEATFTKLGVLANAGGRLYSRVDVISETGTHGAFVPMPPNVTVVVNKHTAYAGRAFRGHMSVPAVMLNGTDVDSGGNISSGMLATLNANALQTFDSLIGDDLGIRLNHRATTANPHPTPDVCTGLTVRGIVGSDRRRTRA